MTIKTGSWIVVGSLGLCLSGCALGKEEFSPLNQSTLCDEANTCKRSALSDPSGSSLTFNVGEGGFTIRCIRVLDNTAVTVTGNFSTTPLVGGLYPEDVDETSPIKSSAALMEAGFTLSGRCVFPFYSPDHAEDFQGAFFVDW